MVDPKRTMVKCRITNVDTSESLGDDGLGGEKVNLSICSGHTYVLEGNLVSRPSLWQTCNQSVSARGALQARTVRMRSTPGEVRSRDIVK